MRWLTLTILAAALAWSAVWFFGQQTRHTAITKWFDERVEKGWIASSNVDLRGYPNRYDAIITDLNLANPKNGWAWTAPRFELLQLTYQPNHIIAIWPETQQVSTPTEKITITSQNMRASAVFSDRKSLLLDRATISANNLDLESTLGWGSAAKDALIAIRKDPELSNAYDIAINAEEFRPSSDILQELDKGGIMPASFTTFKLDATLHYNEPLNKSSFEKGTSDLQKLDINDVNFEWGDLILRATGNVTLDDEGYPNGKLTIRAENWERMVDMAQAAGAIRPNIAKTIKDGFGLLTKLSGNKTELDVPLRFSNRKTRLGPINIGPAPQIKFP